MSIKLASSILTLGMFLVASNSVHGQEYASFFRTNEVTFGLGYAKSFETSPFNVPNDDAVPGALAINLAYRYSLDEFFSIGFHLNGYSAKTAEYTLTSSGGSSNKTRFTLDAANIGINGRLSFSNGKLIPFAGVLVSYATGSIEGSGTGTLQYGGFSVGLEAGAAYMLGESWAISLEGLASYGKANWKQQPFSNSNSTEFNPSMACILAGVSYYWD